MVFARSRQKTRAFDIPIKSRRALGRRGEPSRRVRRKKTLWYFPRKRRVETCPCRAAELALGAFLRRDNLRADDRRSSHCRHRCSHRRANYDSRSAAVVHRPKDKTGGFTEEVGAPSNWLGVRRSRTRRSTQA